MKFVLPFGRQVQLSCVSSRLTLVNFTADGDGDFPKNTTGQFIESSGNSLIVFQIDSTIDVLIDWNGVYPGSSNDVILVPYQTDFFAAAATDEEEPKKWTIQGQSNPDPTQTTNLIGLAGSDAYLNNVTIKGDGATGRVYGIVIDRSGGARLSCTNAGMTSIEDCKVGVSVRAACTVDIAGSPGKPVIFKNNGVAIERVIGGILGANLAPAPAIRVQFDNNTEDIADLNSTAIMLAGTARRENLQSTTAYTATLRDLASEVYMNSSSANTFTIPPHADVSFPLGYDLVVVQLGAGPTTIAEGTGVTINSLNGWRKIDGRYGRVVARQRVINSWILSGDLKA